MNEVKKLGILFIHASNRLKQEDPKSQIPVKKGPGDVLGLIKKQQLKGPHVDVFLLAMANELRGSWEDRESVLVELLNSQHRRLSGLATRGCGRRPNCPKISGEFVTTILVDRIKG